MENVLYCPRPVCQYPVALEPGENMAMCPSCGCAFCIYCKMVYHGIETCRFRSNGCNKIVCGKCGTFFCWLCEVCLNPEVPYKHFSKLDSKCYNILFYGVHNLDVDDDHWWNAGGIFDENAYGDEYDNDEDEDNP